MILSLSPQVYDLLVDLLELFLDLLFESFLLLQVSQLKGMLLESILMVAKSHICLLFKLLQEGDVLLYLEKPEV